MKFLEKNLSGTSVGGGGVSKQNGGDGSGGRRCDSNGGDNSGGGKGAFGGDMGGGFTLSSTGHHTFVSDVDLAILKGIKPLTRIIEIVIENHFFINFFRVQFSKMISGGISAITETISIFCLFVFGLLMRVEQIASFVVVYSLGFLIAMISGRSISYKNYFMVCGILISGFVLGEDPFHYIHLLTKSILYLRKY